MVTADLTGLTPGTTYTYRLTGTTSAGTATGADGQFTTATPPPPPDEPPSAALASSQPPTTSADSGGTVSLALECTGPAGGCSGSITLRTASPVTARAAGTRKGSPSPRRSTASLTLKAPARRR